MSFHFSGYYDVSCIVLTEEVLDTIRKTQRETSSVDKTLRGTPGIVGRTSEALYLQLKDYATKMPVHFAMESLSDVLKANSIPDDHLAQYMEQEAKKADPTGRGLKNNIGVNHGQKCG